MSETALPTVPRWRRRLRPYLLSVPTVAIVIALLYPIMLAVYYVFLNYSAANPDPVLVGLGNLRDVLADPRFWHGVRVTATYATAATAAETVLGIGLALLLNRSSVVGRIVERVLILPLVIAPVIAAVIWKLLADPQSGVLQHLLAPGSTFDWLAPDRALWSTVLVDTWIYTPFVAILVLAGLRSLPREPFEASDVDGAGRFYMFRRLMLPMLWPYILVAVVFRLLDCLKIFDIGYVLAQGGPGDATRTVQIGAFAEGITDLDYSRGSVSVVLLWVVVVGVVRYLVSVLGRAQRRAAGVEG